MMSDFITIATFDNYLTANFEKQKLERRGITCYLADENSVTMQWILSNALGGIKLRVSEEDVEQARQILAEKTEDILVEHTIENNDLQCPNCGSNNTAVEKYSKPIFGISWLVLGFPIKLNPLKICKCFYCGQSWKMCLAYALSEFL